MNDEYRYAAYSYLDVWKSKDEGFCESLSQECPSDRSVEKAAETVASFATYYRVIRTLPIRDEAPRLRKAAELLLAAQPVSSGSVVEDVQNFALSLGEFYGNTPLSAASKLLWLRFKSPVVIYDSVVSHWLSHNAKCDCRPYNLFYEIWQKQFEDHRGYIRDACEELIEVKKFTLAANMSDDDLRALVGNEWFQERVFDHLMLNDTSPDVQPKRREEV